MVDVERLLVLALHYQPPVSTQPVKTILELAEFFQYIDVNKDSVENLRQRLHYWTIKQWTLRGRNSIHPSQLHL